MRERGLYSKYEVRKDGVSVEDCFVLEPEDDRAARVALKAYAAATENGELADDLREEFGLERTPQEKWEDHNESFSYEPPELPGDAWSSEQYQELYDRVISRRVNWFCDKCSGRGPISSLQKARRHVESKHGHKLIEKYETPREEQETATDGGTTPSKTEQRQSENRGLGEFSEGGSDE
jgi:hypothetical protein